MSNDLQYASVFRPGLFAGRTILVTGGGSGLGRCTAHELKSLGARLAIAENGGGLFGIPLPHGLVRGLGTLLAALQTVPHPDPLGEPCLQLRERPSAA